jgi:hypothetical protein
VKRPTCSSYEVIFSSALYKLIKSIQILETFHKKTKRESQKEKKRVTNGFLTLKKTSQFLNFPNYKTLTTN